MKMKDINIELILSDLKEKITTMKDEFNSLDPNMKNEYSFFANELSRIEQRYSNILEKCMIAK